MKLFPRTVARMAAIQSIFSAFHQAELSADEVVAGALSTMQGKFYPLFGQEDEGVMMDPEFFEGLVRGALAHRSQVDQDVQAVLPSGWVVDQLEKSTYALFLCAGYELLADQAPRQVVINEYVNAAHLFLMDRGPAFVNAVVDRLAGRLCGKGAPAGTQAHTQPHTHTDTDTDPDTDMGTAMDAEEFPVEAGERA